MLSSEKLGVFVEDREKYENALVVLHLIGRHIDSVPFFCDDITILEDIKSIFFMK